VLGLDEVVAQGRHFLALESLGYHGLGTIIPEPRSRIHAIKFFVRQSEKHSVGAGASATDERCPFTDMQREVIHERLSRVLRKNTALPEDVRVHEQTVKETVDTSSTHVVPSIVRLAPAISCAVLVSDASPWFGGAALCLMRILLRSRKP